MAVDRAEDGVVGGGNGSQDSGRRGQLGNIGDRGGQSLEGVEDVGVDGREALERAEEAGVSEKGAEVRGGGGLEAGLAEKESVCSLFRNLGGQLTLRSEQRRRKRGKGRQES